MSEQLWRLRLEMGDDGVERLRLDPVAAGAVLIEDGDEAARVIGREIAAIAVRWGIPGYRMDDDGGHEAMGWKLLRCCCRRG